MLTNFDSPTHLNSSESIFVVPRNNNVRALCTRLELDTVTASLKNIKTVSGAAASFSTSVESRSCSLKYFRF